MSGQNFETTKVLVLGLSLGSLEEKWHLDVIPAERHIIYLGRGVVPPPKGYDCVKLVLEVVPTKSTTSLPFDLH